MSESRNGRRTSRSFFARYLPRSTPKRNRYSKIAEVGEYEPDSKLRDFENVPLKYDVDVYFACEVKPHVPDVWMDRGKDRVGYEINFNRHFYKYTPPRPLEVIDAGLKQGGGGDSAVIANGGRLTQNMEPIWQPCASADWRRLPIKREFKVTLGKMLQNTPTYASDEQIPYLKAQNVQWDGVVLEDLPVMWASEVEVAALQVRHGDLLVCEGGEVGRGRNRR